MVRFMRLFNFDLKTNATFACDFIVFSMTSRNKFGRSSTFIYKI